MTGIDLSFSALFRSASTYRVTGQFDGVDLLNGGKHRATDVGNFGMNDPILAPITGRAKGMRHFDGALGVAYALGAEWMLELWHLNATLAPIGQWVDVTRGQVCGRTGNTGARLPDGRPMPAHTHIVLKRYGVPYDVERYLLGQSLFYTGERVTEEADPMATTWRPRTETWDSVSGGTFYVGDVEKRFSDPVEPITTFLEQLIDGDTPSNRYLLALYPDPTFGPEVLRIPRRSLTNPRGGIAGLPGRADPRLDRVRTALAGAKQAVDIAFAAAG